MRAGQAARKGARRGAAQRAPGPGFCSPCPDLLGSLGAPHPHRLELATPTFPESSCRASSRSAESTRSAAANGCARRRGRAALPQDSASSPQPLRDCPAFAHLGPCSLPPAKYGLCRECPVQGSRLKGPGLARPAKRSYSPAAPCTEDSYQPKLGVRVPKFLSQELRHGKGEGPDSGGADLYPGRDFVSSGKEMDRALQGSRKAAQESSEVKWP